MGLVAFLGALFILVGSSQAQLKRHPLMPPPTDSPRATIQSLFGEVERAFGVDGDESLTGLDERLNERAVVLLDLSGVPDQLRADVSVDALLMLYEILSRIDLMPISEIPDRSVVDASGIERWVVPLSEITLALPEDNPGAKDFLFTPDTIQRLREYYQVITEHPKQRGKLEFDTFEAFRDGVGPVLTRLMGEKNGLVTPPWARVEVLFVPAWKLLATIAVHLIGTALAALAFYLSGYGRNIQTDTFLWLRKLLFPITLMAIASLSQWFCSQELRLTGPILVVLDITWTATFVIGAILLTFAALNLAARFFVSIANLHNRPATVLNVHLFFRILAVVLTIGLLVLAAQGLGVPVSGIVTGLGVGGIAVALALQTTLQNLLGGAALLADRPVRVGDFCRFGSTLGTLENIGLRSARIRSLDRTLITIPNAEFANLQIENYTRRDMVLVRKTIGLRFETTPDQLRAILADVRSMLIAHPKVSPDPARARFQGFGDSALEIELFTYIRTIDYNDSMAIQEDLMLRIMDIIARNGGSIAFPSRTLYLRRDEPLDETARRTAEERIENWRRSGNLPFPDFDPGQRGELSDTLPYPPEGSVTRDRDRTT